MEKSISAYFSFPERQNEYFCVSSTGFVLPLTDHFPGILQVKVKANMRSRFFCNIDREYVMECALYLYIIIIYIIISFTILYILCWSTQFTLPYNHKPFAKVETFLIYPMFMGYFGTPLLSRVSWHFICFLTPILTLFTIIIREPIKGIFGLVLIL